MLLERMALEKLCIGKRGMGGDVVAMDTDEKEIDCKCGTGRS
jgi:hypothetical protein